MAYLTDEKRLQIEIDTKECRIPEDVRTRIQPSLERLERAVHDFPASQLWLTIVYHPRTDVYHAQAKLKFPGQTIITGDRNKHLDLAILRCTEKVIRRVEAYAMNPDGEALKRAERQAELASDIIAPTDPDAGKLGEAVARADYQAFRSALLGLEEPIRKRVGRWLQRYPKLQENVGKNFEIADVVEEVFLMAFEQYAERPKNVSLHEWMDGLIDPAVKSFSQDPDDRLAVSYAQTLTER